MEYAVRDVVLYVAKMLRCFNHTSKLMSLIFLAQGMKKDVGKNRKKNAPRPSRGGCGKMRF